MDGKKILFQLGKTVITPGAMKAMGDSVDVRDYTSGDFSDKPLLRKRYYLMLATLLLYRHQSGDWSEMCSEDAATNEDAVRNDHRILSSYTVNGTKYWVITERDRSVTTILLPSEH